MWKRKNFKYGFASAYHLPVEDNDRMNKTKEQNWFITVKMFLGFFQVFRRNSPSFLLTICVNLLGGVYFRLYKQTVQCDMFVQGWWLYLFICVVELCCRKFLYITIRLYFNVQDFLFLSKGAEEKLNISIIYITTVNKYCEGEIRNTENTEKNTEIGIVKREFCYFWEVVHKH